ncbi:hypothetical protein EDB87DRAFT_1643223 [Lactarius vividus]|nr:hypothetical protein EDB87DRAFT_1643223 [Lactarius vividus]
MEHDPAHFFLDQKGSSTRQFRHPRYAYYALTYSARRVEGAKFGDMGCVFGLISLVTGHAMLFLVQLVRVFIGTARCLDGPSYHLLSSRRRTRRQTILYCNLCRQFHRDAVLIWRLSMIWGCNFCVSFGHSTDSRHTDTLNAVLFLFPRLFSVLRPEAMVLIGYRFWKSIQWISKAPERRVGALLDRRRVWRALQHHDRLSAPTSVNELWYSGAKFAAGPGPISVRIPLRHNNVIRKNNPKAQQILFERNLE